MIIIPKIKCSFTPLLMAVIIGHFQICNSILLDCFNWPFMIMAKVIRSRSDQGDFIFDNVKLNRLVLKQILIIELPRITPITHFWFVWIHAHERTCEGPHGAHGLLGPGARLRHRPQPTPPRFRRSFVSFLRLSG